MGAAPGLLGLYDSDTIDLLTVGAIPRAQADPHSLRLRDMSGIDEVELNEQQVRTARHGCYAAISYVDERIGEVLGRTGRRLDSARPQVGWSLQSPPRRPTRRWSRAAAHVESSESPLR